MTRSKGRLAFAAILFIVGLAIFADDLHDFIPGTDWLHWLPEFDPVYIGTFHFEHLYWGIIIMVIALIIAARS